MPRKSRFQLPDPTTDNLTLGTRLAKIRKARGYTQVELAKKIGIIQAVISSYEKDKVNPSPDMVIRLARALGVTTDELLGLKNQVLAETLPNLPLQRRLKKIDALPESQKKALLKTIDNFLKGVAVNK